jgi:hypothetical protein
MRRSRLIGRLTLVSVTALSLLTGCTASVTDEEAPAEAGVSAAPTAPATVEVLVFSGTDVRALSAGGAELRAVDFAGGAAPVVALLSDAIGEPTVNEVGEQCAGAQTLYQWEGMSLSDWTDGDDFVLAIAGAASNGVAIETKGGFSVGDDVSTAVAAASAENVVRPGGGTFVALDPVSRVSEGDYTSPIGAIGYLEDSTTLTSVITPGQWSSFYC